ncbi:MAG: WG repeat-containing protein [Cytophagales bacterium]|nr:WG repeat-containing protein [Cytophagales bacterium]
MRSLFLATFLCISISAWADSFLLYEENGRVGIKNQDGKVVLPAAFEALGWSDGSFSVIGTVTGYRQNNRWGLINLKKEFITAAEFETLVYGGGDYVVVKKKINPAHYKSACFNLRGEVQIPFIYDEIQLHGLRAIVINLYNGRYYYGLTDLRNKILIPVNYTRIYPLGTLRFAVQNEAGKIALFAEDGSAIGKFEIDSIGSFHNSKAIFYKNLNQGLIDRDGKVILEATYQAINHYEDATQVLAHNQWQVVDAANKTTHTLAAENIKPLGNQLLLYSYSGYSGLLNDDWKVVMQPQYQQLQYLQPDLFLAKKNKTGIVNERNEVVLPLRYDSVLAEGQYVSVLTKAGWQLTDLNQTFWSQKFYNHIFRFQHGLFPVTHNGYWGALNTFGEEVVHCVYDSLVEVGEKKLVVKFKDQYGIISREEEWLVAPQPHPLKLVNDSCYLLLQPTTKFLKSYSGSTVYFTDYRIELSQTYWNEYLPDGTIKKLDYYGRILSRQEPPKIDQVDLIMESHEGMRGIRRNGKYGFIDTRGRLRIANRYDSIGQFQEGLAPVKLMGRWGFVNLQDQIVINPNYDEISLFKNGLAVVSRNAKAGIIDMQGKYILKPEYDSIRSETETFFRLHRQGLVGLANTEGRILMDARFEDLQLLPNGMVRVAHGKKFGVVSVEGLSVIPLVYDTLHFLPAKNVYLVMQKASWEKIPAK